MQIVGQPGSATQTALFAPFAKDSVGGFSRAPCVSEYSYKLLEILSLAAGGSQLGFSAPERRVVSKTVLRCKDDKQECRHRFRGGLSFLGSALGRLGSWIN